MTISNDERDLVAQVVARPDEDGPRLDYAAWLDAHGQAPRAELIRVQCQAERLREREQELLARHAAEWGAPLRDLYVDDWQFRRGFPEGIRIDTARYLENHAALAAVTPVTRLQLSAPDDALLARFAALPVNRNLRTLEVRAEGNEVGPAGIRELTQSPHLTHLREFRLHSDGIGLEGVYHVARAPFVRKLTHLTLADTHLSGAEKPFLDMVQALDPAVIQEFRWADQVLGPRSAFFAVSRPGDSGPGR
ncbi:TIGR02996 domain-containing protein [Frigoriglobus tundricola]|uniref:Repeat-companion domain TIGR02996 n=1 Tax=Frigoriglobus tundricola TaxID=2774151 RepID=A0A6M5YYY0_9BACT|nr:TIGR02996 domain-containing protein [Frigoriglobus tundricola]QJW98433.1 hypothetical protein FTUN_6023 [Frigoriglobus tundricola]